jgi:hypothetical protein
MPVLAALDNLEKVVRGWSQMHKPKIKADVKFKKTNCWIMTIEEKMDDNEVNYYHASDLDMHIDWATKQLSTWPNVTRLSWQDWRFEKKSHAEQFITLYYLKWAE